jgi:hypothetical protein
MKLTASNILRLLLPVFPNATFCDDFLFLDYVQSDNHNAVDIAIVFPELPDSDASEPDNTFEYDTEKLSFQIHSEQLPTFEFADTNLTYLLTVLLQTNPLPLPYRPSVPRCHYCDQLDHSTENHHR